MSGEDRFRRSFRIGEHTADVRRDVADEIEFYLEMRERELIAEGVPVDEAKRRAREAFGDAGAISARVEGIAGARVRRRRVTDLVHSIVQDARFGLRGLARSPGFAVAAALTLALGIGANAMVFGLMEASLLRAPAVRSPETLAAIYTTCRRGDPRCSSSYPDYEDYRQRTRAFADVAAYSSAQLTLGDAAGAEVVRAELVTGNYFEVLAVAAARGRVLLAEDDGPGGTGAVAVLSHAFWRSRFGSDARVVGRTIRLNDAPYSVIGIAPPEFAGLRLGLAPALWVPIHGLPALYPSAFDAAAFETRDMRWMNGLVARLAPGASVERARSELLGVSAQLAREDSAARGPRTVTVDPLPSYILPGGSEEVIASFLWVLQGVVGFTLLLACANLANLLLARGSARRRELAVRAAIGAGRRRIVRQLLTESVLLSLVGAAIGLSLAALSLTLISGYRLPFGFEIGALGAGINLRVAAFTALTALATVVAFGTLPALYATRGDLAVVLREARSAGGPRIARLLGTLVAVQIALCVVLLAGAGLFLRTLQNRLVTDLGFRPAGVALMQLDPSMNSYTGAQSGALVDELVSRVAALPGVEVASAATRVPIRSGGAGTFVQVEGYSPAPDEEMRVEYNFVAPDYFRTLGLPIVRGREFSAADRPGAQRVVIVNEEMARAWWPDRDAIGGTVRFRGEGHVVVGVARNAAWRGLETSGTAYLYAPLPQNADRLPDFTLTVIARTAPPRAELLLGSMRSALRDIDEGIAVAHLGTMQQALATTLAPQRAAATLLSAFAGLALILASVGIYGVTSYVVALRRRDFGIRMALGARASTLVSLVARGMGAPVVFGTVAGIIAAVALGRAVRGLIFGVSPTDLGTLGVAVAILGIAAGAATLLPARRAARTDPLEVMRAD